MLLTGLAIFFSVTALLWFSAGLLISLQLTRRRSGHTRRSPSAYQLAYEEIAFTSQDGVTLRGWWIPAKNSARSVIFLHGQGGSMDPDLQYAPDFVQAGYNVLMFDFRAHGRSGGGLCTVGWLERLDVLAAVEEAQRRGSQSIGLLGFSMGGRAAVLAAPFCEAVGALVSDDGPVRLATALGARMAEMSVPRWLTAALAGTALWITSIRAGADLRENDLLRWIRQAAPRPVLLIHGLQDPYVTRDEFEALVKAAGEKAQIWAENAGHRQVDTLNAKEYRRRVIEFFDTSM